MILCIISIIKKLILLETSSDCCYWICEKYSKYFG